jgi:hypothetical protein
MPALSPSISIQQGAHPSPEYELLLACLDPTINCDRLGSLLRELETCLDWDRFIKTANWHGVTPLVYRALSQTVPQSIPKAPFQKLLSFYIANAARNQMHAQALLKLLDIFQTLSIPVLCFKGPLLAQTLYGDLNLRYFADLDLLVRPEDTARARQALMQQNYVPKRLDDSRFADSYLRSQCWDDTFTRTDGAITIDLHNTLTPPYFPVHFDLVQISQRLQPIPFQNKTLYSFCDEDLLLYLCVHGCKELWRRLIWVCDIAELVRSRPQLRWDWILERAQQSGIERIVLLSLVLAQQLHNLVLPDIIQQRLQKHPPLDALLNEFQTRLFSDIDSLSKQSEAGFWVFHHPLHLKMRERWQDKLPQYWATLKFLILPNEEDQRFFPLPNLLFPFYFAIRPLRLFLKFSRVKHA